MCIPSLSAIAATDGKRSVWYSDDATLIELEQLSPSFN
jgi:hypothetical protein